MDLLEPLAKEDLLKALKSIGETEDKLNSNRELIKQWMKCQPHLPSEAYDERIIDIYLRGCKHDLERVKRKLDTYFTVRTMCPDYFGNWDPYSESCKRGWENFISIPLPKPLPNGYRIVLNKYMKSDSVTFQYKDIVRNMFMLADVRMIEEPPFLGDIFIFDIGCFSTGHLTKMTLPLVRKALHCTQNAYPQRLNQIHMCNAPPIVDKMVFLFKQFMKEKIRNRFHIHTGYETMHQFIPKKYLPNDYGGDLPSTTELHKLWMEKIQSYKPYFDQQATVKSDEGKRIKQSTLNSDIFGCEDKDPKLFYIKMNAARITDGIGNEEPDLSDEGVVNQTILAPNSDFHEADETVIPAATSDTGNDDILPCLKDGHSGQRDVTVV